MKAKSLLTTILTLIALIAATGGGYALARLFPNPAPGSHPNLPSLSSLDLPPQTRNGLTATVESCYADASRLFFVIRIEGTESPILDLLTIRDSKNQVINTGYGMTTPDNDPTLFYADFTPAATLQMERLDGQLAFDVYPSSEARTPEKFTFDLNIPIHPALTFDLKQTVRANGIEILLDRVVITPAYTQAYLCYIKPTEADWGIYEALLEINGKSSGLNEYALLFDSEFGDLGKGGDPDWVPPIQLGRCVKIGFPIGDAKPEFIKLTIPTLEQSIPEVIPTEELSAARERLLPEGIDIDWQVDTFAGGGGSSGPLYNKIPSGMTELEAYGKFIRALGYIHDGPWVFAVKIQP